MTKEEQDIIKAIKEMGYNRTNYPGEEVGKVINKAIAALERESCVNNQDLNKVKQEFNQEFMREATPEERRSVDDYIKNISHNTGIEFFNFIRTVVKTDTQYITKQAALDALGEEPYVWTDSDDEVTEWRVWKDHYENIDNLNGVILDSQWNAGLEELDKIITEQYDKSNNHAECMTLRWVLERISELIKD